MIGTPMGAFAHRDTFTSTRERKWSSDVIDEHTRMQSLMESKHM